MSGTERDLQRQLQQLEALIVDMEQGPESPARARARQIVRAVLDLHASALTRMIELIAGATAAGPVLIEQLARDPLVSGVLLLHGLHPDDLESRVRGAVDGLDALLRAQGARLARLAIADGTVRLRLERDPGRGGLSGGALRTRLEQAIIAAAPDAASVEIDVPDGADQVAFVPVEQVRLRRDTPEARPT